jgi:probable addiction module antidote protein
MVKVIDWDMADYIETEEDVIGHLNAAIAENDVEILLSTLGAIARSKGMSQLARKIGVSRESLYKTLSAQGNPSFATIINALKALGYDIRIEKSVPA